MHYGWYLAITLSFVFVSLIYTVREIYVKGYYWQNSILPAKLASEALGPYSIINLGSTYARYSFDYSNIKEVCCYNFALEPQYLASDLRVLKHISQSLVKRCIVIIPIVPFLFANVENRKCNIQDKYYFILDKESIYDYKLKRYVMLHSIIPYICDARGVKPVIAEMLLAKTPPCDSNKAAWSSTIIDISFQHYMSELNLCNILGKDITEFDGRKFEASIKQLRNTLDYCEDMSYRPILVIMPISYSQRQYYDDTILKEYMYNNVTAANTNGAPILDYIDNILLMNSNNYIRDGLMNDMGAITFTHRLISDLEAMGYFKNIDV